MVSSFDIPDRILVAIGGNATHPEDIEGTSREQKAIAASTAEALLPLALLDNELVITHGNGPVVGKILMCQTLTRDRIAPMPLDICVAHSQGGIAYLLVQAMENTLREAGNSRHVACLLTQVEVDEDDPAFQDPSKPIGAELGWLMKEDAGRGWRHSSDPRTQWRLQGRASGDRQGFDLGLHGQRFGHRVADDLDGGAEDRHQFWHARTAGIG